MSFVLKSPVTPPSTRLRALFRRALTVVTAISVATCTEHPSEPAMPAPLVVSASIVGSSAPEVLIGAGNVTRCDKTNDEQTALLLDATPGTVFTTGDNVYGGTSADFESCYEPSWGRHKTRTRPAPGELDYVPNSGYFGYFGDAAGDPATGYYSYDLGNTWHIIVLNSSTAMTVGSAQELWLRADLAATTRQCVLAYWHFPRFSSFSTAVRTEVKPLWDALYEAQADVVVNGHYRLYERFAPQTPNEQADPEFGIRQFTVGTGGQALDGTAGLNPIRPNSEVRGVNVYGALKLTLTEYTYGWEFLPVAGQSFRDSGDGACHGRPGAPPPPNQQPVASLGGPYAAEATVTLDGSGSRDIDNDVPLTYSWTYGDGTTGSGVSPVKTYTANGNYTVSLIVTDALGLPSAPVTTTVAIENLAPAVGAGPDVTVQVGGSATVQATFTDEGGAPDGPWPWTIAWGDGTTSTGSTTIVGAAITASHTYAVFGDYAVRVAVTDKDAAVGSDDVVITVRDPNSTAVLVGAGDIAECGAPGSAQTAALLDNIPGTVITLGDNAYLSGTFAEYTNCYGPTWGRHKARTKPAPGNHDYDGTPGAAGYYQYFGAAAGDPDKGYYSYTAGEWLVVVLNSASGSANRSATSAQVKWLRALLAATPRVCVLAYMHHPQFTSASNRRTGEWNVIDLWNALYDGGVELVLNGHDHLYDRFAPMRPDGTLDLQYGIRQITAGGGGGEGLYNIGIIHPNSQARRNKAFGVAKLTLRGGSYSWDFVPVGGAAANKDAGTGSCHGRPNGLPAANQAPTANPGGPYSAEHAVTFNGAASSDPEAHLPLTYYWTFGDGTVGSGVSATKAYSADGTYTATLVVTDAMGRASTAATTTVTIANKAPTAQAGFDGAARFGDPFVLRGTFGDPGGAGDAPWTWTVAWGDGVVTNGSTSIIGGLIAPSHTYAAMGSYTVLLTVTDKDGGTSSDAMVVTVKANVNYPLAAAGGPYQADQTVTFDASGSTDPENDALTYAWDFGDGTTGAGVGPIKSYSASGTYTATLVVTDALGYHSQAATATVIIANVAPTVNAGPDGSTQIGSEFSLGASFTDPGGTLDAPWAWTIAWGDGTTSSDAVSTMSAGITATHVYTTPGDHTIRLTVIDKDGGSGWDEAVVRVSAFVIVGAGNIARCDGQNDEKTALLLASIPGTVFTTGDNVHASGSASDYQNCFEPSWGKEKARIRPAPGDTDYLTAGASGYYGYFGAAAGEAGKGYYSYDLGTWHIVVLNSSTSMSVGSAQEQWLKADLAATTRACIMAYWHFPRFSSFSTAVRSEVKPLWEALYAAGADVVVNGHYRLYERFAEQTPTEVADPGRGIRQFTVGTGGHSADGIGTVRPNSEVRSSGTYGVLKLTLDATSYSWAFVPAAGQTFTDSGTTGCH